MKLQQTESAVLAEAGRGDQLDVRVGDGGVEGLAEEGCLTHDHPTTGQMFSRLLHTSKEKD